MISDSIQSNGAELLKQQQVATELGVDVRTIKRWSSLETPKKDRLPAIRKGRNYWRLRRADLAKWKEEHRR